VTGAPPLHDPGPTPLEVSWVWAARPAHLVVDLGAVTFLSASSLGVLPDARERAPVEDATGEVVAGAS
jgi:hypothetical protein